MRTSRSSCLKYPLTAMRRSRCAAEVLERAVLPFVDEQPAGRVSAIGHRATLRNGRVLDRPLQGLRHIDESDSSLGNDHRFDSGAFHVSILLANGARLERRCALWRVAQDLAVVSREKFRAHTLSGSASSRLRPASAHDRSGSGSRASTGTASGLRPPRYETSIFPVRSKRSTLRSAIRASGRITVNRSRAIDERITTPREASERVHEDRPPTPCRTFPSTRRSRRERQSSAA